MSRIVGPNEIAVEPFVELVSADAPLAAELVAAELAPVDDAPDYRRVQADDVGDLLR
jgi:hypothetical protein